MMLLHQAMDLDLTGVVSIQSSYHLTGTFNVLINRQLLLLLKRNEYYIFVPDLVIGAGKFAGSERLSASACCKMSLISL